MKYLFCNYYSDICSASDPYLTPVFDAQQSMWTVPTKFNADYHCYWIIKPPTEFTTNTILKIKIDTMISIDCKLNFGGTPLTASEQEPCF